MSTINIRNFDTVMYSPNDLKIQMNTSISNDQNIESKDKFLNPRLENVTEWLIRSFDQSRPNFLSSHLLVQKSQRSNSIGHVRIVSDEPFVEINLNKNFYSSKSIQNQSDSNLKQAYSKYQDHIDDSELEFNISNSIRKCCLTPPNLILDETEDTSLNSSKKNNSSSCVLNNNAKTIETNACKISESSDEQINSIQYIIADRQDYEFNFKYKRLVNESSYWQNTHKNEGEGFSELTFKRKDKCPKQNIQFEYNSLILQESKFLNNANDTHSQITCSQSPNFFDLPNQNQHKPSLISKFYVLTNSDDDKNINPTHFRTSTSYNKYPNDQNTDAKTSIFDKCTERQDNFDDFEKLKSSNQTSEKLNHQDNNLIHSNSNKNNTDSNFCLISNVTDISHNPSKHKYFNKVLNYSIKNENVRNNEINENEMKSELDNSPFGDLQLQITHIDKNQHLIVKILKARNLIAKDTNGFSDPYVKVYLLPGRE